MTAPPTRKSSPCVPDRRSSLFKSSNNLRRSAWVSGTTSDSVAQCRIDEDIADAERRWRMRQKIQAQTLKLRAEHGLRQRCDCARPCGDRDCAGCASVLDHRSNVILEKGRQARWRRRRDRIAQLTCGEVR